ncbi:uncharacterized protein [Apostichopus japonicus]|uniref:uncharacterized protein n=1 Tax=Stichopus japonicus TaxID=307972 RepID=UPI003AB7F9AF
MKWEGTFPLHLEVHSIHVLTNSALRDLQFEFEETEKSEELASRYGLFAYVHLLPSFNTRKSRKCSRDDNVRYFIAWQPIGTNVEEYAKKSQLSRKQPHLLAIGSNVTDLQQFL